MIDMHVHYFPPAVFKAIWRYFETHTNGLWHINYRMSGEKQREFLRAKGIERFTTLVYAHKKDLAMRLNDFIARESALYPELIAFGTLYAGDGALAQARTIFEEYRFFGIKLHPFVSGEEIDDERYFPAYELMLHYGKILLCHPGSAPVYQKYDGVLRIRRVLSAFPEMKLIIAHCGAYEYEPYQRLAEEFPHVYFDTAMNCVHTPVFEHNCPGPAFFQRFQDRVLFGTDFPNIPYDYQEQIDSLKKLKLGEQIEKKIFKDNALSLLFSADSGSTHRKENTG
ncbi:MAG: amidohydrolase family protein [Spirochaetales bacterium]|nr:amidohydrolase family protein [Spirochaetales bacterium]